MPSGIARAHTAQIRVVLSAPARLSAAAKTRGIATSLAKLKIYILKSLNVSLRLMADTVIPVSNIPTGDIQSPATFIAEVKNESPDIIVLTGDLVHDRGSFEPGTMLARKLALVSDVYFVTGNHDLKRADYVKFQEALDKTSTVTLHNESVTIEKNGKEITLSGIEDPFSETGTNVTESILNSVNEIKETDNYHIALFHRANHMDLLCNKGFDLIISGHMHGGQVRLPNGRGVCSPRSSWGSGSPMLFPKYFAGHYTKDGTDMIVSRGIGNPMIIPRLFNRPELTVIILKSENK